jgi:c-di-GMP-binding flagellar brake protein YcgR
MDSEVIDRRQQRRADLRAQVVIRNLEDAQADQQPFIGRVRNVSLSGVYAFVPAAFSVPPGSSVAISVSIPQESTRQFPFVRLLGKGWVVRIDKPDAKSSRRRTESQVRETAHNPLNLQDILGGDEVGVAIAFSRNVTALGAVGTTYQ